MQIEQLGVDLTGNIQINSLGKRLTSQPQIKVSENLINKVVAFVIGSGKTIIPSVRAQKYLVLVIVVLSLILAGYRYNNYNNKLVLLENAYSAEKVKESNLIGVKIDYELAQKRNKLKNDRIFAIKGIQKTQLLVSTIFTDFQVLSYQSQFKDLVGISSMQITGSSIRIAGEAIDKIGAVAFVNKVQENTQYEDVFPTYKSLDNIRCGYELNTKFIGNLPSNQLPLPRVSPLQVAATKPNANER